MRYRIIEKIIAIIMVVLLLNNYILNMIFAEDITAILSSADLYESNLDGAVIQVALEGDEFITELTASHFDLVNEPSTTVIESVYLIDSTHADLTLSFDGTDFDEDILDFHVKALKEGLKNGAINVTTNSMIIQAVVEVGQPDLNSSSTIEGEANNVIVMALTPSISITSTPAQLDEENLNNAVITVTLTGDEFIPTISATHFDLVNEPGGTTKYTVALVNPTTVNITLAFTGQDFDTDKASFYIKARREGLKNTTVDLNSNQILIKSIVEAVNVTSINPSPLMETSLNGTIITVTLTGDKFVTNLDKLFFQLLRPVAGLSIARVDRLNDRQANVVLSFNGTDFDANKTDFAVRLFHEGIIRTGADLDTPNMTIYSVQEGEKGISATSSPSTLYESSLNGSIINLIVREDEFQATILTSYFQINNAPNGVGIQKVTRLTNQSVAVELYFTNEDFDNDFSNFSITALPSALRGSTPLTSNTLTIYANKEVEGQGSYIVTGESYPTSMQIKGYNVRTQKLYLNAELCTTKPETIGVMADFQYCIEVINHTGDLLGNVGSVDTPLAVAGNTYANIKNEKIPLNSPLPVGYRIILIVVRVIAI